VANKKKIRGGGEALQRTKTHNVGGLGGIESIKKHERRGNGSPPLERGNRTTSGED